MHEYSIVQAMFDQIDEAARVHGARAVRGVRVRIGAAAGVDVALLRTAYDMFREGTICANAPLAVNEVAVKWRCPDGHEDSVSALGPRCTVCGRPAVLAAGDEIILDSLDLEVR